MTNAETAETLKIISTSLWSIARGLDRIERMLRDINVVEGTIMKTTADIKAAEIVQGEKIDRLVSLTDAIFGKLSASGSADPVVQEILDMIAAHNATMDAAVERDTLAG